MLPVGVDAAAVRVVLPRRVLVAGRDDHGQAAVLRKAQHLGPPLPRELGRAVPRAVVDDEHIHAGKLAAELVEDPRQALLLVQSRDEDHGVGLRAHARSSAANCVPSAATIFSLSSRASSSESVRSGERNSAWKAIDFRPSGIPSPR